MYYHHQWDLNIKGAMLAVHMNEQQLFRIYSNGQLEELSCGKISSSVKKASRTSHNFKGFLKIHVSSLLQLNRSYILVADSGARCIKYVSPNGCGTFAGTCDHFSLKGIGHTKGGRLELAQFAQPRAMVLSPLTKRYIYLADKYTMLLLDLGVRNVTIIIDASQLSHNEVTYMAAYQDKLFLSTTEPGVIEFDCKTMLIRRAVEFRHSLRKHSSIGNYPIGGSLIPVTNNNMLLSITDDVIFREIQTWVLDLRTQACKQLVFEQQKQQIIHRTIYSVFLSSQSSGLITITEDRSLLCPSIQLYQINGKL